jgi:S-adenosylmethionine synthetase
MDKVSTEILERLCNGDSHMRIACEMNIPESWITEAVDEFNREARSQPTDMFGNVVDDRPIGMN